MKWGQAEDLPAIHDAERICRRNDTITPQLVGREAGQRALEHCEVGLQIGWKSSDGPRPCLYERFLSFIRSRPRIGRSTGNKDEVGQYPLAVGRWHRGQVAKALALDLRRSTYN